MNNKFKIQFALIYFFKNIKIKLKPNLYRINLISAVLLVLAINANAGETATGAATSRSGSSASLKMQSLENKADSCPPALVNWVKDDFSDKSTLGLIDFPSEAKTCRSAVKSYEERIKKSDKKLTLGDKENQTKYLEKAFPQISPNASHILNKCNSLTDEQSSVAKTRYYTALSKLESHNSVVLDEVAAIDSLIPEDQTVTNMECNSAFPFPKVSKKCEDYKENLNGQCKVSQQSRLNRLVEKTKEYSELQDAVVQCKFNSANRVKNSEGKVIEKESCDKMQIVLEQMKSQMPWLDGKKFNEKFANVKVNHFWKDDKKSEEIKKGIVDQLKENRKTLTKQYGTNLQYVKCMTYSDYKGNAPCDFEDARNYVMKLPSLKNEVDFKKQESIELSNQIEAESCLLERGTDRQSTKKTIDDAVTDAGAMLLTGGATLYAKAGFKLAQGMSSANKVRLASATSAVAASANAAPGMKQVYESCSKQSDELLKFKDKPEVAKDNICPDGVSAFEKAQDDYDDCFTNALLSAADVWPLVKGLKLTNRFSRQGVLDMYKDPKQRSEVEKILAKNGKLSEEERKEAAETVLGRKLSPDEKNCVMKAHNVAGDKFMKIGAADVGEQFLNQSDLVAKKNVLRGCFSDGSEVALLMRTGITGSAAVPSNASDFIRKASVLKLKKDLTPAQVSAVWDVKDIRDFDQAKKILMASGLSEEDAAKIAKRELMVSADAIKHIDLNKTSAASGSSSATSSSSSVKPATNTTSSSSSPVRPTTNVATNAPKDPLLDAVAKPMDKKAAEKYIADMAKKDTAGYDKLRPSQQDEAQIEVLRNRFDDSVNTIYKMKRNLDEAKTAAEKEALQAKIKIEQQRCMAYNTIRVQAGWIYNDSSNRYYQTRISRVCGD